MYHQQYTLFHCLFYSRVPTAAVQWPTTPTVTNAQTAAAAAALGYNPHQPAAILAAYPTQPGQSFSCVSIHIEFSSLTTGCRITTSTFHPRVHKTVSFFKLVKLT